MGGGSIRLGESDEPDRDEGDLENQSSSRNRKRRCSGSPLRCLASNNPIVGAAASAYRATAETAGRVSNSAQSRLRSTLNSAQSRFGQNNGSNNNEQDSDEEIGMGSIGASVSEVNTKEDLEKIFKENEYNLFKVLLGGYDIDLSLLNDLEDWSRRRILLSMGLDETGLNGTEDLETIAKDLDEFFIKTEAKGLDLKFFRILLILHFPPSGQDLHVNGLMDTDGTNGPPVNPTLEEIYMLATLVLVEQFGVSSQVALIIAMNTIVPTDVIPITLPHDAATKPPELADDADEDDVTPEYLAQVAAHEKYKKARVDSKDASVKHIDKLAQEYPFPYAIVSGSYPWKFYNEHLKGLASFKNIKVLQEFALIHPSALLDSLKNSKRQAFELSFYLSATFSALAEKPVCDITLDGPQRLLNRYIKKRGAGKGEYFYGAWYNGTLVLLEHSANELESLIKKQVSSLPSSRNNLKRSWGSTTNSKFPKQEDLVARLSGETNQGKTISYYHLDIGVFYWEDCLKDELPDGSLRDYGLPPRGERNTYKNITMGVQNDAVLGDWGAYVEANAKVQGTRNSSLVARISASLTAAADDEDDEEDVVDEW